MTPFSSGFAGTRSRRNDPRGLHLLPGRARPDFAVALVSRERGRRHRQRYLRAVDETIRLVAQRPDQGRLRRFAAPELHGIRSLQIRKPFDSHLLFYSSGDGLRVERVMHGARDLPDRLVEPPGP